MATESSGGNGVSPSLPSEDQLPTHVAIIMDGNGRWARSRGLPRLEGHRRGADVVREITTFARELGIAQLTLYSFSVQNWRRPPLEVAGLMQLLEDYCEGELSTLIENDIRLTTIGRMDRLPPSTRAALERTMRETAGNRAMTLTLAIDYGGREELVAAVRHVVEDVRKDQLDIDEVDIDAIESRLMTATIPPPDLVVRTSGERRISNFLLWQIAYAELYFTDTAWPDFTRTHFVDALNDFASRERRFGATSEQGVGGGTEEMAEESDYVPGRIAATPPPGSGESG